jgi:tetratricopeptide (TPR) repeat protein
MRQLRRLLFIAIYAISISGCVAKQHMVTPKLVHTPQKTEIQRLTKPFQPLSPEERTSDWGKEYIAGLYFAYDYDLYRAVTDFKRALVFLPEELAERRQQIEYDIILAYYIAEKYSEALDHFDESTLTTAKPSTFPAYESLLIILHDIYNQLGEEKKSERLLTLAKKQFPELAERIELSYALRSGNLEEAKQKIAGNPKYTLLENGIHVHECEKKSETRAATLNAILPGAGYAYIGQRNTAFTAFSLNALFIAATWTFADRGNWAAAAITGSLEVGWYIGGINGGAIAANRYNRESYRKRIGDCVINEQLYPIQILRYGF